MEDQSSDNNDWDWEVVATSQVPKSEEEALEDSLSSSDSSSTRGGVIQSDYFTLDYAATAAAASDAAVDREEADSDNPSWVDPSGSSVVVGGRKRGRSPNYSSESSSDSRNVLFMIQPHSDCGIEHQDQEFSSFEHMCFADNIGNTAEMMQNSGGGSGNGNIYADSGGNEVEVNSLSRSVEGEAEEEEHGSDQLSQLQSGDANDNMMVEEVRRESVSASDEKKRVVWWKVPLEVMKYCVWKVNPVWSLSVAAAAIMGFVLLRRRWLYKMKRKSQGLQLKVTVDDKKVSQFMSRAARLNEAFSVVKRVPIIRPAFPAPGMTPWPMVSLR